MDPTRRLIVGATAGTLAAHLAGGQVVVAGEDSTQATADDAFPPLPTERSPGKPGDFGFLDGHWRIANRRRRAGESEWDRFDGEATCWSILDGVGSVEELRIPARRFSGMGLRLLDVNQRLWNDHWVNSESGVIGPAGLPGSFEDGKGIFRVDDRDDEGPMIVLSLWDQIGDGHCRWRQAVSRDGGARWEANWIMHWTRTARL
jgi:hypothetical protein